MVWLVNRNNNRNNQREGAQAVSYIIHSSWGNIIKTYERRLKSLRHAKALLIKFILAAVVLEVDLLLLSELNFFQILYLALLIAVASYIVGDLVILPATNNIVATISDVVLSLIIVFIFNIIWNKEDIPFFSAIIAAVVIGIAEWFFHKAIDQRITDNNHHTK